MDRSKLFMLGMCALVLASCQETPSGSAQSGKNQYIVYMDEEQGVDPYQTRIIVTPQYVRFDDGEGSADYVVFDRNSRIIYSVNSQSETVMRVHEKKSDLQPPFALIHSVRDLGEIKDAPKIQDHTPHHFQYLTNDTVCVDVISLPDLMPEAVVAMKEFHEVLATDSASTFNNMPADMHLPCEISLSTFAPTQHLQNGFPLQEWKPGYSRRLVDFKQDYQADPALFELPDGYFNYAVQEMREGKVDFANRKMVTQEQK